MEYWILWTILLSIVVGALGIYYLIRNFHFFKRHGVIHIPFETMLSIVASVIFRRISFIDFANKVYNFYPNAKYFGIYGITSPFILLRDPELIKAVLIKNFDAFPNRRGFSDLNELFAQNMFSLRGDKWRYVRNLLSPAFTSGKLKTMFTLMSECAVDFVNFLSTLPANESDMDTKDAFTKYTNDVIATCAFGIKVDSMKDPTNKFYIYGKDATDFSGIRGIKFMIITNFTWLARILNLRIISDEVTNFFRDIVKTTIATRDAEHITRPDMMQLMMDIRGKEGKRELSIDDMTAQAFNFFFGGFEISSTVMSFAAHAIATNPDVQVKLQQEIDKALEESSGEVTYEIINQLEYLEAVVNESLRLYSPVIVLERLCEKDYELPPASTDEKSFTVKKGMMLWIPASSIHYDENYYDNPEKFCPERFLNNKTPQNSLFYMPFGLGPRMCIANRFAILEIKVLLFHLLAQCELKPCGKTVFPLKFSKKHINLTPEGGFWLNIQRRSDMHSSD